MKREFIDKLNGTKIGIYVNREASGVDEDGNIIEEIGVLNPKAFL